VAAEALEQSVLESKDKDQLLAIAKALGVKARTRTKKSDIIGQILETTGGVSHATNGDTPAAPSGTAHATVNGAATNGVAVADAPDEAVEVVEIAEVQLPLDAVVNPPAAPADGDAPVLGDDGEPLAEWELALRESGAPTDAADDASLAAVGGLTSTPAETNRQERQDRSGASQHNGGPQQTRSQQNGGQQGGGGQDDGESRNRRRPPPAPPRAVCRTPSDAPPQRRRGVLPGRHAVRRARRRDHVARRGRHRHQDVRGGADGR
jgi:transcription termination factor Rho